MYLCQALSYAFKTQRMKNAVSVFCDGSQFKIEKFFMLIQLGCGWVNCLDRTLF